MARLTYSDVSRFPAGTVLGVYSDTSIPPNLQSKPVGPALETATVAQDGSVTFIGLEPQSNYWVGAEIAGNWRYDGCATGAEDELQVAGTRPEIHDDFTMASLGNFTQREADSGQTYVITGDTIPTIEVVDGQRVLSIANAVASGNHSFYLQAPLSGNCRYVFAKVMFGSEGTTDDSAVALASPATSIASADGSFDIGIHGVLSASGGVEASTWVNMTPISTSDLDGSNLYGSAGAPTPGEAVWCGWILCENGTMLLLAPDGEVITARDSRYIINSGPFAWVEPCLTAGDTDVRPYVLEWCAGSSVAEAVAALGEVEEIAAVLYRAEQIQASLGRDTRGDKVTDAGTPAGTSETDLHSFTISGGTFHSDKDKVVAKFAGTTAANSNNKRIRAYFGETNVFDSTSQAYNGISWEIELTIVRVSATTFRVTARGLLGANVCLATYTAVTATAADALALKITGTNGSASANDIVSRLSTWEKAHAA